MANIKWKKESGLEIETDDSEATILKAKELGWKRIGGNGPKDEPKATKKDKDSPK